MWVLVLVSIRRARLDDARFVYDLRFMDESVKSNCWSQDVPVFDDHLEYFKEHLDEYYIIGNRWGFIRQGIDGIGIYLSPEYRNRGIGSDVLRNFKGSATIKMGNLSSFFAFLNAGFKPVGWIMKR